MPLTSTQRRKLRQAKTTTHNRVKLAMQLAGLTQMEVAAALRLSQPYVSDVARGRFQTVHVDKARKFAQFFGVTIEELFP